MFFTLTKKKKKKKTRKKQGIRVLFMLSDLNVGEEEEEEAIEFTPKPKGNEDAPHIESDAERTRMVQSQDPVPSAVPSGETFNELTRFSCP